MVQLRGGHLRLARRVRAVKVGGASVLTRWTRVRRWLVGACVLAVATGASGESAIQRRPTGTPNSHREASPTAPATRDTPGGPAGSTAPAVSPSARHWWLALLTTMAAGLGVVALLAVRRRARPLPPAPTYGEGWQGIGGPSYAPRPTTERIEPRNGKPDTTRGGGRREAARRQDGFRRPFGVPTDFDASAFLASARQSFVRLQSAWDRSDLNDLNECTTDEMFNALTHELRVRVGASRTEVVELTASLLAIETAAGEYRASVRFSGNLKVNGEDERLDEVWNLSKAVDNSGGWLLAGIQQLN